MLELAEPDGTPQRHEVSLGERNAPWISLQRHVARGHGGRGTDSRGKGNGVAARLETYVFG
jgi:hypothetical protein